MNELPLLQEKDEACNYIVADQCQARMCHAQRSFQSCLSNENIHCDVDGNLWPNPQDRVDGIVGSNNQSFALLCLFFEPGEEHCSTCFTYSSSIVFLCR